MNRGGEYELLKVVMACLVEAGLNELDMSLKNPGPGYYPQAWIAYDNAEISYSWRINLVGEKLHARPKKKDGGPAAVGSSILFELGDPDCFKNLAYTLTWYSIHPDRK